MELFLMTKAILIKHCVWGMGMVNTQDGQNHMELDHKTLERAKTFF